LGAIRRFAETLACVRQQTYGATKFVYLFNRVQHWWPLVVAIMDGVEVRARRYAGIAPAQFSPYIERYNRAGLRSDPDLRDIARQLFVRKTQ
jgi:hypothetical protein